MIRVGLGFDSHKLVRKRKLILGGVIIPSKKGELAHSDGDVLLHAIIDSLLGASGLGDIGSFFPPEDKSYKNADSKDLLKIILKKVYEQSWKIENIDCVIQLEKPKFLPYRQEVIDSIASLLQINTNQVFVKAKTAEKKGPVGKGKLIQVWTTCLLSK